MGLIGLGGIAVFLGWKGVSTEALTSQQVPYIISGGIGGLFLLGTGAMLWLSADLRDEWRKLDAIEHNTRLRAEIGRESVDRLAPVADVTDDGVTTERTTGEGTTPAQPDASPRGPRKPIAGQ